MDPVYEQLLSKNEIIDGFTLPSCGYGFHTKPGQRTAILEIAGIDSIAAAITAAQSGRYDLLIPTIVYTGSEYGDWNAVIENARRLSAFMRESYGVDAPDDPVILGSPQWFHALSGRFVAELYEIYAIPATCISCHMYLHAVRVPLAKEIGASSLISGERLDHDGRLKINQLRPSLEAYKAVLNEEAVALEFPLKDLSCSIRVKEKASPFFGSADIQCSQMRCVLESNYRDHTGNMNYKEDKIEAYLNEFLVPATTKIIKLILSGEKPVDYVSVAAELISERGCL